MSDIVQQVDILEILRFIGKKNKKLQAILLQELETIVPDKSSPAYIKMRKVILDETSNFARSVIQNIFGDIEVI